MKKNLLFIIPGLGVGGAEKSLVNLLNQIDYERYNVDLFMFNHEGIFNKFLPREINILSIPHDYTNFSLPIKNSLVALLKSKKFNLLVNRIMFTLTNYKYKGLKNVDQYNWKYIEKCFNKIDNTYDAAIGFLEKTSIYYCVEKVNATKKIGFIHNDYDNLKMDSKIDMNYFKKLDKIFSVSEECVTVLKNRFPSESNKIDIMYNIVSPTMINKMAEIDDKDLFNRQENEKIIISIGRLHHQKGFELAIEACKKLIDNNFNIKWFVIGEGLERNKLIELIRKNRLENKFILLGLKSNPYPYIKQADIYVQTSRYEGKSIALDEAKILNKPIVVTNYTTAKDQISHGVDGLIVDMNEESISKGIEKLISDKTLRERLCSNLQKQNLGTEKEIEKLYDMV